MMVVTVTNPYGQGSTNFGSNSMAGVFATWDLQTAVQASLSTDLLTATNTTANSMVGGGAHVDFADAQTNGKYYYEITITDLPGGSDGGIAVGPITASYYGLSVLGPFPTDGVLVALNGDVYTVGALSDAIVSGPSGGPAIGDVIGVAIDLDVGNVWFKIVGGPDVGWDWNGGINGIGAGSDPATDTLGVPLPLGAFVPWVIFANETIAGGLSFTANFGETPFAIGTAGFNALGPGWDLWP